MTDERDEIRARVDIVDLVGASVRLEKKGKSYKGLCPFHSDKNPSFDVSPETGRYTCWSCGEKGDIFTWVMKTQNVDFPEALRTLAQMAGVTLKERHAAVDRSVREVHQTAMAEAQEFFRDQFRRSSMARAYCERRGLPEDVLDTWGIGYSPEGGEALTAHLKRKNLSLAESKNLFLVDQDSRGGYYDKFRGRLMFPIWNEKGDLVAFGGRVLGAGEPKYINSSDTPLYRKSRVLYGMNQARTALQKSRQAVLVEGYLDVIACHRAGVTSALASLGTSLSEEHAKLLKRWVEEVVILYDSDSAGQKAADRASKILLAEGLRVSIALMPDGQDPDTLLAVQGPVAVQASVAHGLSPVQYRVRALERTYEKSSPEFWEKVVPILAEATSELELDRYIVGLAHQYPGVSDVIRAQKSLRTDVVRFRSGVNKVPPAGQDPSRRTLPSRNRPHAGKIHSAELVLFRAFIDEPFRKQGWLFVSRPEFFLSDPAQELARTFRSTFSDGPPEGPLVQWIHKIESESMISMIEELIADARGDLLSEDMIEDSVRKMRLSALQLKFNNGINTEMTSAERAEMLKLQKLMKPDKHQKMPTDELF